MTRWQLDARGYGLAALVGLALTTSACSNLRETFGLDQKAPDEFTVVRKAPLTLPPDFNLRPPRPGAPRPQELDPRQQAQSALSGGGPSSAANARPGSPPLSAGEQALLRQAGTTRANANIREVLTADEAIFAEDETFVERIMFWRKKAEPDRLNPTQEQRRLQQQTAATNTSAEPDLPVIRRKSRSILSGVF